MTAIDALALKEESERKIQAMGGKTLDWLPHLDRTTHRDSQDVAKRALVVHAMLQISFGAPSEVIEGWVEENGLSDFISEREAGILEKEREELSEQELTDLRWYLEALWAFVWAGGFNEAMPINEPIGDQLASFLPNLQTNESGNLFVSQFKLRSFNELLAQLDLYFRAHWYARDGQLNGYDTAPFSLSVIMERRKSLEWICDSSIADWGEIPMDT